jgi:dolichyl-phosphate-mannose--protein O-mannosyl transferase
MEAQDNSKYTIQEAICEIMLQDKSKTWTFEELTAELGKVKKKSTFTPQYIPNYLFMNQQHKYYENQSQIMESKTAIRRIINSSFKRVKK